MVCLIDGRMVCGSGCRILHSNTILELDLYSKPKMFTEIMVLCSSTIFGMDTYKKFGIHKIQQKKRKIIESAVQR